MVCKNFSLVCLNIAKADVFVCAALDRIYNFDLPLLMMTPKYFNLFALSSSWLLTEMMIFNPSVLFVEMLDFLLLISVLYLVDFLSKWFTKFVSFSSPHASPSKSSSNLRLMMINLPLFTGPMWFPRASTIINSRKILKKVGERSIVWLDFHSMCHFLLILRVARTFQYKQQKTSSKLAHFDYKKLNYICKMIEIIKKNIHKCIYMYYLIIINIFSWQFPIKL